MASVLFVNALQVNFASVLTMEHSGMVKVFKSLEDSGLKYFWRRPIQSMRRLSLNFLLIQSQGAMRKSWSFDQVTSEKLDIMIAITTRLKVNWAQILFQVLLNMVKTPKRQSQGFAIQVSALMQHLVKENLGEWVKMHPHKVLTSNSVHTYIKRNSDIKQTGESSKQNEVAEPRQKKQKVSTQTVEARRKVATTNFDSEESSETDSCPLVARRCKRNQVTESSNSESTISFPLKAFAKIRRTQRPTQQRSADDEVVARLYPVEEHCQQVIKSTWNNVSAQLNIFKEWVHFRKEVRIKDISSLESLVKIEEQLLEWGETEELSELFERRSLILYKRFELEVEKVYHEHLANFKLDDPSVNHDYLFIRRLNKELNLIATVQESSLSDHEQAAAWTRGHQIDHPYNENTAIITHEHQAQANKPPVQTEEHQAAEAEHQAHDEQGSEPQNTEVNLEKCLTIETNSSDHLGPLPTNLQLVVPTPTDPSTLQLMDTTAQTLTALSTRVSPLDLTCARIHNDTNLTRHHTTLLHEQLKNVVDGMDIKIVVLERTLSKRMDDSHQHFTKLEITMVRNYADSHQ
ncbi:hypothetical protein F511_36475 [Dorcoceras hygrometricum]|uniref:Uncharacterized protein n=1 Tax=Dorcoceras hygrometricum TaxID=472368 RepID=A0A2Z7BE00_9LAMI|nr:hypothetical protein F511_36475 [Dorcoceras hygrometricum]